MTFLFTFTVFFFWAGHYGTTKIINKRIDKIENAICKFDSKPEGVKCESDKEKAKP